MSVFKFKGRSPLLSKYIWDLLFCQSQRFLSFLRLVALLKGSVSFPQSFYASPERKSRHGKATFVHPECVSVSVLVWIRHMSVVTFIGL